MEAGQAQERGKDPAEARERKVKVMKFSDEFFHCASKSFEKIFEDVPFFSVKTTTTHLLTDRIIKDPDGSFRIELDLPGIVRENVSATFSASRLTVNWKNRDGSDHVMHWNMIGSVKSVVLKDGLLTIRVTGKPAGAGTKLDILAEEPK